MTISPLTNSQDVTLLKSINSDSLILEWKNGFNIDISKDLKQHKSINLYQCNESKLRFFLPLDVAGVAGPFAQDANVAKLSDSFRGSREGDLQKVGQPPDGHHGVVRQDAERQQGGRVAAESPATFPVLHQAG